MAKWSFKIRNLYPNIFFSTILFKLLHKALKTQKMMKWSWNPNFLKIFCLEVLREHGPCPRKRPLNLLDPHELSCRFMNVEVIVLTSHKVTPPPSPRVGFGNTKKKINQLKIIKRTLKICSEPSTHKLCM